MTSKLCRIISLLLCASVLILADTAASAVERYKLGDADSDSEVTIIDATCIQRYLTMLPVSGIFSEAAADVDVSGEVEITDATFIQRWLTEVPTPYSIGTQIEAPTEVPTQRPTDEEGWGRDIFRP